LLQRRQGAAISASLEATLTFQHIGNLPVEFSIAGVGAMEPSGGAASAGDAMKDMKMK
jgi:hypothetical protein